MQHPCFDLADRAPAVPLRVTVQAVSRAADWIGVLLVLWFARHASNAAGDPAPVLQLAESLVLVWVLIRLSSMLVSNESFARAIAVLAWMIAALNIAGLITPVIELLDAMALPIGNFRVSVLLLLKGVITLAILLWIANTSSRLADQRLNSFALLTPVVQVLAAKLVRMTLLTLAVVLALGSIGIDLTAFAAACVKVGISYQSDPNEAIRLALEAARETPRVLEDPAPTCLLLAFDDSTIDLELRSWIGDPAQGMANIRSQIMLRMWDLFQEQGIELPIRSAT